MKLPSVLMIVTPLVFAGCSSGPPPIKPGSPAFFWAVARESYRTGDLLKTQSTLLELSKGESEFAERARIWHLVVSAGVMKGLDDLADAYQSGSDVTPIGFRKEAATLRGLAASAALEFTQAVFEAQNDKAAMVHLAFGFPPGEAASPRRLETISGGTWLGDVERESLQRAVLQRGVILAAAAAVGKSGDPEAARAVFQGPDVPVAREAFYFGMAKLLFEGSDLFGPKRLDRPERQTVMCREAIETLGALPETKETKDLAAEIQAAVKKIPGL